MTLIQAPVADFASPAALEATNSDETSSSNIPIAVLEERLHQLRKQLGLVNPCPQIQPQTHSQPNLSASPDSQTRTQLQSQLHVESESSTSNSQQKTNIKTRSTEIAQSSSHSQSQTEHDPAVEQPQLRSILRSLPALPSVLRIRGRRVSMPPSLVSIGELPDEEGKENKRKRMRMSR